jgi:hypothetical protein
MNINLPLPDYGDYMTSKNAAEILGFDVKQIPTAVQIPLGCLLIVLEVTTESIINKRTWY